MLNSEVKSRPLVSADSGFGEVCRRRHRNRGVTRNLLRETKMGSSSRALVVVWGKLEINMDVDSTETQ